MHTPSSSPSVRSRAARWWPAWALVVVVSLFAAACGGGSDGDAAGDGDDGAGGGADAELCPVDALEDADGPIEITAWHAWVGKTATTLEQIANDYNASQDRVVVKVESQGTYEEMLKKYEDSLADPASLPDIVMNVDTATQFMIDSGTVIPAAACLAADPDAQATYDDILPAVTAAYTVEDVLWPAAFSVSEPVLYTNNNHMVAAGLDPADPPANLEELRAAAEAIKAANLQGVGEPLVLRMDSWYLEHWLTGDQIPIVDEDNGRSGLATTAELTSPETQEIFDWFKAMHDDGLLKAVPYANPYDQLFAMALQSSSMLIDTSTAITTVDAAISGTLTNESIGAVDLPINLADFSFDSLSIGVGLNPGLTSAGQGQIGGAAWYVVDSGDAASIAATWDFVQFSNETPQQVMWTLEGSYLPISTSARQDPAIEAEFTSTRRGQWLAVAADGLELLDAGFPGPVVGPYNQFREIYRNALEQVTLGGAETAPLVEESNAAFQTELEQYASEVAG
ncbi:MAG: extracellular solute-binding protein [Microthrixaceae bacterium]